MNLAKTSFFAMSQTAFKLLAGFIVIKLVAILAGPAGIAEFGIFQNFSTILIMLSGGVAYTGVTKLMAGTFASEEKRQNVFSTSLIFVKRLTYFSLFIVLPTMILIQYYFFNFDLNKLWLLVVAAPFIFFQSRLNFQIAVLNGLEKVDLLAKINIISSIGTIILAAVLCLLTKKWQTAALALYVVPAFYFCLLSFRSKFPVFKSALNIDSIINKELRKYSYFGIVSAICLPVIQLIIRNQLVMNYSVDSAGLWQGVNKLSEVYLVLISSILSIYLIPKVSASDSKEKIVSIVRSTLIYTLFLALVLILSVYFLKSFLINILFSKSFLGMSSLFAYQLPGDFFKIISWVFSFSLLAKGHVKDVLVFEIASGLLYLLLAFLLINKQGLVGSILAYTLNYAAYLVMVLVAFYMRVGRYAK